MDIFVHILSSRGMFTSAIILAAGSGRRMGFDKMTARLCGKAVILYSIERFVESNADEIIIAASEDNTDKIRELVSENINTDKPIKIITGGATRFESAVKAVRQTSCECDVVSVHDGARPFVTAKTADKVALEAFRHGAALAAVRAKDTVKICDDGVVTATPDRSGLWLAQTPQAARKADYLAAAEKLDRKGNAVPQGAWGRIVARVQKQYTAAQALEYEALVYTGRSSAAETLYLPGYAHTRLAETPLAGEEQTEWLPLRLGRLALPACICRVTTWEQQTQPVRLTDTAAVALAVRTCRAQLLRDFPDAEIEAEQRETTTENGTAAAAVTYIFTADIARTR